MSHVNAEENGYHECAGIAEQLGRKVGRKFSKFMFGFRSELRPTWHEATTRNNTARALMGLDAVIRNTEILKNIQGVIMGQVEELRSSIIENAAAVEEAVVRVNAKIAELGLPDPDLTRDIELIRAATAQIKTIADPATPDPGDEGFDPGPVVGGGETDAPAEEAAPPAEEGDAEQSSNG